MRRSTVVVGAVGLVLLAAAAVWLLLAPGALVKYPDDLNKTAVAKGTITVYVDPATGAPLPAPQRAPLAIRRNLRVVSSTGSEATVQETSSEQIGARPAQKLLQRYVVDRSSLKNRADPQAYAYTPRNITDRSGVYSINLPFATGDGPYPIWKNETATTYQFQKSGADLELYGLTLKPMIGRLPRTRASQAYIAQLAPEGIRSEMTIAQLAPQLQSMGIDPQALAGQLLPALTAPDRAAAQKLLAAPVPIKYFVAADTRLLVEPTTGAIVSLDGIDQTLSALPDLTGLARLGAILSKPQYASNEAVQGTLSALKGLEGALPVAMMRLKYSQTPASVADIAAYTKDKAGAVRTVETTIPLLLSLLGATALIASVAFEAIERRAVRIRVS
jgi:hypothetical protein